MFNSWRLEHSEWLDCRLIHLQYFRSHECEHLRMHLIFVEILLQLMICILEYHFLLDGWADLVENPKCTGIWHKLFMLCQHEKERVLERFGVQRDIIKKLHHTCYQLEWHEGHSFLVVQELLKDKLVIANHMNWQARVDNKFFKVRSQSLHHPLLAFRQWFGITEIEQWCTENNTCNIEAGIVK